MSTITIGTTGVLTPAYARPRPRPAATGRPLAPVRRVSRPGRTDRPAGRPGAVARPGVSGLRLTRRGRLVVTVGAVLLALGALLSAQGAHAGAPQAPVAVTTHTVTAGDTLWSLARTVALPGEDLRDVVDELIRVNGLPGASIQVGQMLIVPQR